MIPPSQWEYVLLWSNLITFHARRPELITPKLFAPVSPVYAFPQTAAPTTTQSTTEGTTHNISMPPTVYGLELLLTFIEYRPESGGTIDVNTPSGWTPLWQFDNTSFLWAAGYAKVAAGDEGGGVVDFSSNVNAIAVAHCYRVTNWFGAIGGVEASSSPASGTSSSPNPPALSPSWGSANTLWFSVAQYIDDDAAVTAYPTNYSNGIYTVSGLGTNAGAGVASARRELAADNDNPGVFTLDQTEGWGAQTVAVRPAA